MITASSSAGLFTLILLPSVLSSLVPPQDPDCTVVDLQEIEKLYHYPFDWTPPQDDGIFSPKEWGKISKLAEKLPQGKLKEGLYRGLRILSYALREYFKEENKTRLLNSTLGYGENDNTNILSSSKDQITITTIPSDIVTVSNEITADSSHNPTNDKSYLDFLNNFYTPEHRASSGLDEWSQEELLGQPSNFLETFKHQRNSSKNSFSNDVDLKKKSQDSAEVTTRWYNESIYQPLNITVKPIIRNTIPTKVNITELVTNNQDGLLSKAIHEATTIESFQDYFDTTTHIYSEKSIEQSTNIPSTPESIVVAIGSNNTKDFSSQISNNISNANNIFYSDGNLQSHFANDLSILENKNPFNEERTGDSSHIIPKTEATQNQGLNVVTKASTSLPAKTVQNVSFTIVYLNTTSAHNTTDDLIKKEFYGNKGSLNLIDVSTEITAKETTNEHSYTGHISVISEGINNFTDNSDYNDLFGSATTESSNKDNAYTVHISTAEYYKVTNITKKGNAHVNNNLERLNEENDIPETYDEETNLETTEQIFTQNNELTSNKAKKDTNDSESFERALENEYTKEGQHEYSSDLSTTGITQMSLNEIQRDTTKSGYNLYDTEIEEKIYPTEKQMNKVVWGKGSTAEDLDSQRVSLSTLEERTEKYTTRIFEAELGYQIVDQDAQSTEASTLNNNIKKFIKSTKIPESTSNNHILYSYADYSTTEAKEEYILVKSNYSINTQTLATTQKTNGVANDSQPSLQLLSYDKYPYEVIKTITKSIDVSLQFNSSKKAYLSQEDLTKDESKEFYNYTTVREMLESDYSGNLITTISNVTVQTFSKKPDDVYPDLKPLTQSEIEKPDDSLEIELSSYEYNHALESQYSTSPTSEQHKNSVNQTDHNYITDNKGTISTDKINSLLHLIEHLRLNTTTKYSLDPIPHVIFTHAKSSDHVVSESHHNHQITPSPKKQKYPKVTSPSGNFPNEGSNNDEGFISYFSLVSRHHSQNSPLPSPVPQDLKKRSNCLNVPEYVYYRIR